MNKSAHLRRQIKWGLSLICISAISTFVITTPLAPDKTIPLPTVKAAFTQTPPVPYTQTKTPPVLSAEAAYVVDVDSGVVLLAKNPNKRLKPASLTKVMTALVSMDYYNEGQILKVKNGYKALGAKADLRANDEFTAEELLYALLVPSGNDAAVTLAENYPGGYSNFVSHMNEKATFLKLTNSHFSSVSGVDISNHYTSAYDIGQVALEALKRPVFRRIVSTKKITLKSEKGNIYPLFTTNQLLGEPGIEGVKTGWTPAAGECLITLADRYNHPILISVLGSRDRFGETEKILDWVYENYIWQ